MRRFVVFAVLLTIGCASEEQPSTQAASTIMTEAVEYTAGETVMKGYLAYDSAKEGLRPGVLVVHEWWGHNDYARKRAEMLAELGYTALAVDMYGDGQQADHPDDAMKFVMAVVSNMEDAVARFNAAYDLLKQHETTDPEKTAAIGYCFGGSVVISMANLGIDLDAVASFHGGLQGIAPPEPGKTKARVLVCNGGADPMVTPEQIEGFKQSMSAADVNYEFVNYDGALHSFTNPAADSIAVKFNMPVGYNAAADEQSWEAMKKLFEEVFSNSGE